MAVKKQRVSIKITDLETGAEQLAGDITVLPGFGFSCSCSTSSLTTLPVAGGPVATQQ